MRVTLAYQSGIAIYEQIKTQIREQIVRGELKPHELLPSIRTLAKELQIGIITAKRAYDDLCAEGFLYTVQGKGVYVSDLDARETESYTETEIRSKLADLCSFAENNAVGRDKLLALVKEFFKEN